MAEEAKHLETSRTDRSVWLMKCPTIVSKAWQEATAASDPNPNPVVAKVILSFDPLSTDEDPKQFKMEMAQADNGNTPKNYSILDKDNGMGVEQLIQLINPAPQKEKKKATPTKPFELKRTRRDRKDLENILFRLFEKQPNWSLKHLMQETDQPEQFLKEIMNDLCVYNKRGPNQGTHELKPEYKKSLEDTNAT